MLAVSPFRSTTTKDEDQEQIENFSTVGIDDFSDLSDKNLLESIDFDDLFDGINGGEVLPDLEMDSEILAEFYISGSGEEDLEVNLSVSNGKVEDPPRKEEGVNKLSGSAAGSGLNSSSITRSEEIVSRRDDSSMVVNPAVTHEVVDKGRKSSTQPKNNQGKRKVDWTPELHRRFVQAVEQLGLDKAVPSRILELMGTGCLTRHNIASHLQKYRSHRKHFLEREAEAARWSQRPKMNAAAATVGGGGKVEMNPWHPPTMGFPPTPITTMHHHHPFRPLHVWGHPYIWSKRLAHSPSPPPPPPPLQHIWAPPPPAPSYWHQHHRVSNPNGLTPGTPFFPQPLPQTRFGTPPVQGIPPHTMYKVDSGIGVPTAQLGPQYPLFDFHPSKESVDAAIGDVLSKPWLPLPLRLKPPSLDSVLVELQRQGIRKIPPACTS